MSKPIRCRGRVSNIVVDFTDICTGTIVAMGNMKIDKENYVGYTKSNWARYTRTDIWDMVETSTNEAKRRKLHEMVVTFKT